MGRIDPGRIEDVTYIEFFYRNAAAMIDSQSATKVHTQIKAESCLQMLVFHAIHATEVLYIFCV